MTVREEIAQILRDNCSFLESLEWADLDEQDKEMFRNEADQILSIKGIRVECENQELPEIPEFQYDPPDKREWLKRGAINYSKILSGWVKCLKKEEHGKRKM